MDKSLLWLQESGGLDVKEKPLVATNCIISVSPSMDKESDIDEAIIEIVNSAE